ncbi:MAG: MlaD family protein [Bacteroidota bacterium]
MFKLSNEIKFGIFAVIAAGAMIYGLNFLAGSSFFGPPLQLSSTYPNVDGLLEGDPILMNGMRIGRVKDFKLDVENGQVNIKLEFFEKMSIPKSFDAMIASRSVLGEKAIKLVNSQDKRRLMEAGYYETGNEINGVLETGIIDNVTELAENQGATIIYKVAELATELQKITAQTQKILTDPGTNNSLTASINNVRDATSYLTSITIEVDSIAKQLTGLSRNAASVVENFEGNNDNVTKIFSNVKNTTDSLVAASDEIKSLLTDASSTVGTVEEVVGKLKEPTSTLGKLINTETLHDSLVITVMELNSLLREAKANPQRFFDDIKLYLFERNKRKEEEAALKEDE